MLIRTPILALTLLAIATTSARADEAAPAEAAPDDVVPDEVYKIARDVVRTIRRSIALGPTLGGFSTYAPSASELEGGLSFGLELELFQSRLPTLARVREIARQKALEKLAQIIRDRFAGQSPDLATQRRILLEVAEEIKAQVLADLAGKPRLLERPRLALLIEANYLFSSADWLSRLGGAFGIGPVSIGPTFSVRFGNDIVARLGAELSIHLMPTKSVRSPVLDLFLRGDFELHARGTNDDQLGLGVRVLFDLI